MRGVGKQSPSIRVVTYSHVRRGCGCVTRLRQCFHYSVTLRVSVPRECSGRAPSPSPLALRPCLWCSKQVTSARHLHAFAVRAIRAELRVHALQVFRRLIPCYWNVYVYRISNHVPVFISLDRRSCEPLVFGKILRRRIFRIERVFVPPEYLYSSRKLDILSINY